jgi:hypothetical protein
MKQILLPLFAASLMLTLGFCRQHPTALEKRTRQFDSCVTLGREAVAIANDDIRKLDSAVALLEAWKWAALKCNPNIKVSGPFPSPLPATGVPRTGNDTVKPKYRYFYTVDPNHLNSFLYVTDSLVSSGYGIELGGTVIKNSTKFYTDYKEILLRNGIRRDSVLIKK